MIWTVGSQGLGAESPAAWSTVDTVLIVARTLILSCFGEYVLGLPRSY